MSTALCGGFSSPWPAPSGWRRPSPSFFPFTADDSYIVARYAENLVDHGELAYNLGERVMAFTSPLQVAVEAVLYRVTGATVTGYKLLGVALFLLSFGVLLRIALSIIDSARSIFRRAFSSRGCVDRTDCLMVVDLFGQSRASAVRWQSYCHAIRFRG